MINLANDWNNKQKIIDFLLQNADPSIILRVKREVLGSLSESEEQALLEKIIRQKNVQTIIRSQKPDGWIGNNFHGQSKILGAGMYDNMEIGLRYLAEKGFPPENEYIAKAIRSFLNKEPFGFDVYRISAPPKAPDTDYSYPAYGLYLMRSSVIIRTGYEYSLPPNDFIDIKHDIDFSLRTFAHVLNYASLDDAVDTSKKQLCFRLGIQWPCSYDLRILAHSKGWRNSQNLSLLANSLNHLFSFSHSIDKMVYTYIKGSFRGPCFAFIHKQMYDLGLMDESSLRLDLMELFARCGIIKQVDFLKKKYEYMFSLVNDDLTINYKVQTRDRDWSPYYGFALEEDWKNKTRQQCDLLFRVLLIMHYTELGNDKKK